MLLEKMREKKGITLIALVITIIVLLILAGVTIAMVVGDNGILKRSNEAKESTLVAQAKEEIELQAAAYVLEYEARIQVPQAMHEKNEILVADQQTNILYSGTAGDYVALMFKTNNTTKYSTLTVSEKDTENNRYTLTANDKDTGKFQASAYIYASGKPEWIESDSGNNNQNGGSGGDSAEVLAMRELVEGLYNGGQLIPQVYDHVAYQSDEYDIISYQLWSWEEGDYRLIFVGQKGNLIPTTDVCESVGEFYGGDDPTTEVLLEKSIALAKVNKSTGVFTWYKDTTSTQDSNLVGQSDSSDPVDPADPVDPVGDPVARAKQTAEELFAAGTLTPEGQYYDTLFQTDEFDVVYRQMWSDPYPQLIFVANKNTATEYGDVGTSEGGFAYYNEDSISPDVIAIGVANYDTKTITWYKDTTATLDNF
ncbi:MAG: type II secretion system protein [Clostridia bacterium]|nr:type II secretion system protein [Clostridia bacterium]